MKILLSNAIIWSIFIFSYEELGKFCEASGKPKGGASYIAKMMGKFGGST